MLKTFLLEDISSIKIQIKIGDIVFLHGDLAAGKTTLTKHILNNIFKIPTHVTSPTYTYYNKYEAIIDGKMIYIYHFDLYRINNYDEFFAIGGEEILNNPNNISIIEWPEVIGDYYKPNIDIYLRKTDNDKKREIEIK